MVDELPVSSNVLLLAANDGNLFSRFDLLAFLQQLQISFSFLIVGKDVRKKIGWRLSGIRT